MAEKKIFIRESSGLVRQMSSRHAFAKVLAMIVPISVYYTMVYSPALPGANWTLGIILASIVALPIFLTYLKLAEHIPRSSGEYIYITRILNPALGGIQAVANIFSTPLLAAILSQIEISAGIAPAFQVISLALHNSLLLNLGTNMLVNPTTFEIASFISLILFWVISILPPRYMSNFLFIIASLQVIGGILIVALLLEGPKAFAPAFNSLYDEFSGPTYSSLYSQGLSYYSPIVNPLQTLIWMILMVMWLFVWFFAPSYFAGEYKVPGRSIKMGMLSGYIIASAIILGLVIGTEYSMGIPFFNYVSLNGWGSSIPLQASSGFIAWGGVLALSSPILAFLVAILNLGIQFVAGPLSLAIPSRVLLAMSFDRLIPEKFAYVNLKLKTPLISSIFVLALALIFEYVTINGIFIVSTIVLIGILFLYQFLLATVSAIVAGIKGIPGEELSKKDKIEFLIYGSLASIVLAISVFFSIWYASVNSLYASMVIGNLIIDYLVIGLIPVVGLVFYFESKEYRLRQGIDINLAFKLIPPE
ncbi:APC family permease [Sulfolobus sp. S-194]|uniref:APC family permease n=1 Tax=Sulfolobus sp. S-194 TaxID=2512240 RepID=UPI001436FD09|nr:APC family permease [Sulfolobus sp. S-194]QIW23967.1 APC family permease [Sulfolobus sp. S-194]